MHFFSFLFKTRTNSSSKYLRCQHVVDIFIVKSKNVQRCLPVCSRTREDRTPTWRVGGWTGLILWDIDDAYASFFSSSVTLFFLPTGKRLRMTTTVEALHNCSDRFHDKTKATDAAARIGWRCVAMADHWGVSKTDNASERDRRLLCCSDQS